MSTWNLYIFNTSTLEFPVSASATIPRPNEDLIHETVSTQQRFKLADGSSAFFTPETKTEKLTITLIWQFQEYSLVQQIQEYMTDNEYIKIETHLSGLEFIGRFVSCSPTWLVGVEDKFNIQANFEVMED